MPAMMHPPAIVSPAQEPGRAAILAAARGVARTDLGLPVRFKVEQLTLQDDWAFLRAAMQDTRGHPVDLARSRLAGAAARGMASDRFAALLKQRGRGWTVIVHATAPTDESWAPWAAEYGAPASMFRP